MEPARDLLTRAIAIDEKAYASDHPMLATRYNNLALVEQDLGNLAGARVLMRKAYRIIKSRLGLDHPNTQKSLVWLKRHDPAFREDTE